MAHQISLLLALTIIYSFIIIIITYSVENEWVMSKWGNTPCSVVGIHNGVFSILCDGTCK